MSAVSGLTAKGEKGKSKYVALDINSLYKGKSLENPKATVLPKHGLQSLGKVGAGRRMPPPANLPSLKSENSGNNPNINLVPSGGQGWGTSTKEKGKTEETSATQQQSQQPPSTTSASQGLSSQKTPTTSSSTAPSKTWSSVTSSQEDGGQERNFLGHQSPFFPQEFPKLAGGDAQTEGNRKSNADSQYGPGPSLRPQTEGSWGRGTLQQQPVPSSTSSQQPPSSPQPTTQGPQGGGQPPNNGSGVNGQQNVLETQMLVREQKPYPISSRGGPLPPNTLGTSNSGVSGSASVVQGLGPASGGGHGITGQMGPGSTVHPQLPQFRGMMPPYMYGRNFPGGYPNYTGVPPTRQPYPYTENRMRNSMRPLAEEEAYQRPAAIITDKDLKGFDEILQNDTQDGWASVHGEIDYNAKLVFSDEEETASSQKKDIRNHEEKNRLKEACNYEKECERDHDQDREDQNRDADWEREDCTNDKREKRDVEWDGERRDRDDRWKTWVQQPQGRPGPPLGMDLQRQWQSQQQQQRVPFDYRGPPPRPQGGPGPGPYASPHSRIGPVPPPQSQQHIGYSSPPPPPPPPPRTNRPGRPPSLADDDELWRQRRRQHSDEMTLAVERARQRREEEEKRYEQSKQSAQEKLKSFAEGTEKGFSFSRQFQKNVPPRFQKQAELLRQQHQQQPSSSQQFLRQQQSPAGQSPSPSLPMGVGYGPHWGNMPPPPPYLNQMPGMTVPSKSLSSGRSDSQGSGTDSYDSDRRTPDQSMQFERDAHYWGRERRQPGGLQVPYDGWRPAVTSSNYYDKGVEFGHGCEQTGFKQNTEKEEPQFVEANSQENERRSREFDKQEYNCRDDQEHNYEERTQLREIVKDTDSWTSSREYGDRMPDPFDEPNDTHNSQDKWERPQRPDSRDSRASKESAREERINTERQGSQSSLSDKESKVSAREEKERTSNIEWGDTPYPAEPKRHHEWHHPPPITQKQLESVGPTKKNFTPLRRNASNTFNSNSQEKKTEASRELVSDIGLKKQEGDVISKELDKKEDKLQKSVTESEKVDKEKCDKNIADEKCKKAQKVESVEIAIVPHATEPKVTRSPDKLEKDVKNDAHDKNDNFISKKRDDHQQRDKRQSGRERGIGPRSRGGGRSESSRGRGRNGGYGPGNYGGRSREYRRSRVDKGPRFDKQHDIEWQKDKDKEKEKPSEESSASEVDDGKLDHMRQKDEDSEISVDDTSASTNESVQAEKRRLQDDAAKKDSSAVFSSHSVNKDSEVEKTDKKEVARKDASKKLEIKTEERPKEERGGFYPRGEPSRRGRGSSVSIRNSRGGPRYGPSRYGPPPSRAAFGGGRSVKTEEPNIEEETKEEEIKDKKQDDDGTFVCNKTSTNKSRSVERIPPRRTRESLPPRFQKRQAKRYENSEPPLRGRTHGGRGGGIFHGGNVSLCKAQAQKENLSDVANEEWETASESSDVAERRERKDLKEENMTQDKKDLRENRNPYIKKSFSGQRPINDSANRRPAFDSRRGRSSGENRQRENFGRETRRDTGRGRATLSSDKRSYTGNNNSTVGVGNPRFGSNSGNQPNKNIGRNSGRGTQPQSKYNFAQKNEGSAAVFRIDEIRRDPRGIQAALTDLANRNMKPSDVTPSPKSSKPEKEKSNALEGYDLNNYASVVIIDDQPEVTVEDPTFLCDADDGFQEVTSKKRHKTMLESDVKKLKKEPRSRNKSGSRLRQNRLPPRLAKQRENNQFHSKSNVPTSDNSNLWDSDIAPSNNNKHPVHFPLKDAAPAPPPPVNAWQKPIVLKPHSSVGPNAISDGANTGSATCTAITSSGTTMITEIQALTVSSKSSSFDRSDQHDSGIDVSDQPTSAASSQRSSPSNDCKILGPKGALTTVSVSTGEGCTELDVSANGTTNLAAVRNELCKTEAPELDENKAIQLPVTFSTKEPFGKGEEGSDMKLDFTFDSELAQLTEQKSSANSSISHAMQVTSGTSVVGVQSPISPSADELNLKIASVKKVWENVSPMPTVLEHPPTGSSSTTEEGSHPDATFSSFSTNTDHGSSLMNGTVDNSVQNRKDSSNMDTPEVAFRTSPSMQQTGTNSLPVSLVSKGVMNMEQNVCKVKTPIQSHQSSQIPGCTAVSPPPIGLDQAIGLRALTGLTGSVQVAGIPAVPSPPTVLFNSSQQMAQTGLYQHLPMDGSQVLTQQTRAVAAAIAQFPQPPHGYATPLGTYSLSHQPANAQLSSAYGQQNVFMQTPPSAHQPQDLYSSSQYRVQPPYPQGQHVTSNQVLNAQQNLPTSHLLGSQLVQTRPTPGPAANAAGPATHLQGLHGIQAVQPAPSTSYYSTSAQGQNATSFYPQPTALTAPGSPMQQQQQAGFPSQQGFGSQSALNVLTPGAPSVAQNFRGFGGHQFKGSGMSSITGGTDALRSSSHSPTMDSNMCARGGVFTVGNTTTTTVNSGSVMTVPQITSTGITSKIGQQQSVACTTTGNARITSTQRMTSQSPTVGGGKTSHGLLQSSQQYYSFNQQKYGHVQASPAVRPVLFQGVVRNNPHQAQYAGTSGTLHYPSPIQRPGGHNTTQQQPPQQTQRALGRTQQMAGTKVATQLTTAQQAKLRAEAVQQTHRFFNQTSGGKPKIDTSGIDKSRTAIKSSCPSNANLEETKGLKTSDLSTTSVLSQDADIQKVIENKDSKLEE